MTRSLEFPESRFSATPGGTLRRLALAAALAALSGCQAGPSAGPEGSWSVLPDAAARLTLAVPGLPGEARRARFRSADRRYAEETAQWGRDGAAEPRAGLRLSEASPGPPLTDPKGPADVIPGWTALQDKRPAVTEMGSASNALGPASWWRAGLGTSVCAVFVQRLPPRDSAAATLSGFYCNPPGTPLSPQAAAAFVQSVGLRPPPPAQ